MLLGHLQGAVVDQGAEHHAGDGADDLVLLDDTGNGDVPAEFGDAGEHAVVGGAIDEDGVL